MINASIMPIMNQQIILYTLELLVLLFNCSRTLLSIVSLTLVCFVGSTGMEEKKSSIINNTVE